MLDGHVNPSKYTQISRDGLVRIIEAWSEKVNDIISQNATVPAYRAQSMSINEYFKDFLRWLRVTHLFFFSQVMGNL